MSKDEEVEGEEIDHVDDNSSTNNEAELVKLLVDATFFSSETVKKTRSIFSLLVKQDVKFRTEPVESEKALLELVEDGSGVHSIALLGEAGSGKTSRLIHFTHFLIERFFGEDGNGEGRVPLFVELRKIRKETYEGQRSRDDNIIVNYLHSQLLEHQKSEGMSKVQIADLLSALDVLLILDGYDELEQLGTSGVVAASGGLPSIHNLLSVCQFKSVKVVIGSRMEALMLRYDVFGRSGGTRVDTTGVVKKKELEYLKRLFRLRFGLGVELLEILRLKEHHITEFSRTFSTNYKLYSESFSVFKYKGNFEALTKRKNLVEESLKETKTKLDELERNDPKVLEIVKMAIQKRMEHGEEPNEDIVMEMMKHQAKLAKEIIKKREDEITKLEESIKKEESLVGSVDKERYRKLILGVPALVSLCSNAYMMTLIFQNLPHIVQHLQSSQVKSNHEAREALTDAMRLNVFEAVTSSWLRREASRLSKLINITCMKKEEEDEGEVDSSEFNESLVTEILDAYCRNLADHQFRHGRVKQMITKEESCEVRLLSGIFEKYEHVRVAFESSPDLIKLIRDACLSRISENQFMFSHNSITEYFATEILVTKIHEMGDWINETNLSSEKTILSRESFFTQSISRELGVLKFMVGKLQESMIRGRPGSEHDETKEEKLTLLEHLFRIVDLSKSFPRKLTVAASNALTILTYSGIPLSKLDFRGITAQRTVFHEGILDGTDFSQSNLSGSFFDKCLLRETKFNGACLKDCKFDIKSSFRMKRAEEKKDEELLFMKLSTSQEKRLRTSLSSRSVSQCGSWAVFVGCDGRMTLFDLEESRIISVIHLFTKKKMKKDIGNILSETNDFHQIETAVFCFSKFYRFSNKKEFVVAGFSNLMLDHPKLDRTNHAYVFDLGKGTNSKKRFENFSKKKSLRTFVDVNSFMKRIDFDHRKAVVGIRYFQAALRKLDGDLVLWILVRSKGFHDRIFTVSVKQKKVLTSINLDWYNDVSHRIDDFHGNLRLCVCSNPEGDVMYVGMGTRIYIFEDGILTKLIGLSHERTSMVVDIRFFGSNFLAVQHYKGPYSHSLPYDVYRLETGKKCEKDAFLEPIAFCETQLLILVNESRTGRLKVYDYSRGEDVCFIQSSRSGMSTYSFHPTKDLLLFGDTFRKIRYKREIGIDKGVDVAKISNFCRMGSNGRCGVFSEDGKAYGIVSPELEDPFFHGTDEKIIIPNNYLQEMDAVITPKNNETVFASFCYGRGRKKEPRINIYNTQRKVHLRLPLKKSGLSKLMSEIIWGDPDDVVSKEKRKKEAEFEKFLIKTYGAEAAKNAHQPFKKEGGEDSTLKKNLSRFTLSLSPSGKKIALLMGDGSIHLWMLSDDFSRCVMNQFEVLPPAIKSRIPLGDKVKGKDLSKVKKEFSRIDSWVRGISLGRRPDDFQPFQDATRLYTLDIIKESVRIFDLFIKKDHGGAVVSVFCIKNIVGSLPSPLGLSSYSSVFSLFTMGERCCVNFHPGIDDNPVHGFWANGGLSRMCEFQIINLGPNDPIHLKLMYVSEAARGEFVPKKLEMKNSFGLSPRNFLSLRPFCQKNSEPYFGLMDHDILMLEDPMRDLRVGDVLFKFYTPSISSVVIQLGYVIDISLSRFLRGESSSFPKHLFSITHAAIYVGGGRIIEASGSGGVVMNWIYGKHANKKERYAVFRLCGGGEEYREDEEEESDEDLIRDRVAMFCDIIAAEQQFKEYKGASGNQFYDKIGALFSVIIKMDVRNEMKWKEKYENIASKGLDGKKKKKRKKKKMKISGLSESFENNDDDDAVSKEEMFFCSELVVHTYHLAAASLGRSRVIDLRSSAANPKTLYESLAMDKRWRYVGNLNILKKKRKKVEGNSDVDESTCWKRNVGVVRMYMNNFVRDKVVVRFLQTVSHELDSIREEKERTKFEQNLERIRMLNQN